MNTGRAPTAVLFDGLDNCKEMSVVFAGVELAFRGFHTLAIDGPRQDAQDFTAEDGGFEHCQVDNRRVGTDYIADWLAARLCK